MSVSNVALNVECRARLLESLCDVEEPDESDDHPSKSELQAERAGVYEDEQADCEAEERRYAELDEACKTLVFCFDEQLPDNCQVDCQESDK